MQDLDRSIFFDINHGMANPALDYIMAVASSISLWLPILIVGVIIAFLIGNFKIRAMIICGGLSIGVVDGLFTNITKDLVERPRPYQTIEDVRKVDLVRNDVKIMSLFEPPVVERSVPRIWPVHGRSFPSGHAANNFAVAGVLIAFYGWWGALYLIPATIVAFSRIYVGVHYPSDVVVSALFGVGLALFVVVAANEIWKRFAGRVVPRLASNHPDLFS